MPDCRFEKLMGMEYACILIEGSSVMFDMEMARKVSTTYGLPFKRTTSKHPSLHTFLREAFDSESSRHEFLAHLIVEHELKENNLSSTAPNNSIRNLEFEIALH